jgi:hypothetical protein
MDDMIDNLSQRIRVSIREHENYQAMMDSLSEPTRKIVDTLLKGNVTPELIKAVSQSTPQEYRRYTFLRALEGGNPSPAVAVNLTNLVLDYIEAGLDEFWEYEDDPDL